METFAGDAGLDAFLGKARDAALSPAARRIKREVAKVAKKAAAETKAA